MTSPAVVSPPVGRTGAQTQSRHALHLAVVAVAVAGVALGVALRAWALTHHVLNADEAVVGLMAEGVLHGHGSVFYWGQDYGGGEAYVAALLVAAFGRSGIALESTAAVLSVLAALTTWRVARRLTPDRGVAALAGVLVWVAPEVAVRLSTMEYGFRGVTMLFGLLALLAAVRLLDGYRGLPDWAGLGLSAGIAWWSSPEAVYYLLPAFLLFVAAVVVKRAGALVGVLTGLVGFAVGAAPWLVVNLTHGFESLRTSNFQGGSRPLTYSKRLSQFFHLSAPIELGLKRWGSGLRTFGAPGTPGWEQVAWDVLLAAVCAVLAAALLRCVLRRDRAVAVAVGAVAFPFVYAASPATWFWQDGRYGVYLGPLLALLLAAAIGRRRAHDGRSGAHRAISGGRNRAPAMAAVVVVSALLTCLVFGAESSSSAGVTTVAGFFSGWRNPDAAYQRGARILAADGLVKGYASYWIAYQVDFYDAALRYTTVGNDVDRSAAINRAARSGSGQSWLFDTVYGGPAGATVSGLEAQLRRMGVSYRVTHAGPYTAITPARRLSPERQLGETHVP